MWCSGSRIVTPDLAFTIPAFTAPAGFVEISRVAVSTSSSRTTTSDLRF
jgi:hypothetical protein